MKNLFKGSVAAAIAGAMLIACTGDDNGTQAPGTDAAADAKADGSTPGADASRDGATPGLDGAMADASGDAPVLPGDGSGTDGSVGDADGVAPIVDGSTDADASGDGAVACNFAAFVKGLIANDTTMTARPSADLGQSCTDDHDQAEFRSLFP